MKKLALCAFLCSLIYSSLHAQTSPRVISYQGLLRPAGSMTGSQIAGNRLLTVTLYGDADGTVKLWQSTINTLIDSSGIFNCMLGTPDNPLPEATALDRPIWVGIAVGSSAEMRPLAQFTASPYALNVADSSITSSKLNMNYVSSISVNGQPITGVGTNLNLVAGNGLNLTWVPDQSTLTLSNTGASGATTLAHNGSSDYWGQTGNNSTNPDTNYVGTSDSVALEIHVNNNGDSLDGNGRVMRYEPMQSSADIIGGNRKNYLTAVDSGGDVIAGGGNYAHPNWIAGNYGTVSGGYGNAAYSGGVVGGGTSNFANITATVAGGTSNAAALGGTVGGGIANITYEEYTTISGGWSNTINPSAIGPFNPPGLYSSIGGVDDNNIYGPGSTIPGGGQLNLGSFSFGYNGDSLQVGGSPRITDLSLVQGIGYFGNVNVMIGNVDSVARQLRFYGPNTSLTYGSSAKYTAFRAPLMDSDVLYTLPNAQGANSTVLTEDGHGNLSWGPGNAADTNNWSIKGNHHTSPPVNFLGTLDSNSLELHVFDSGSSSYGAKRVMRYEVNDTSANILGGYHDNAIVPLDTSLHSHIVGVVIAGGGANGSVNTVKGSYAVISGGNGNTDTVFAVVDGGSGNSAVGAYSVVAGGSTNIASGNFSSVTGGSANVALGDHAVISGGAGDSAMSNSSSIVGGDSNSVRDTATYAHIGGGFGNVIDTDAAFAGIVAGQNNLNQGNGAVIAGGSGNKILYTDPSRRSGTNSFIGAGSENKIDGIGDTSDVLYSSAIVAGDNNYVGDGESFVGAGSGNSVSDDHDFIVSGGNNTVYEGSTYGGIAGGLGNKLYAGDAFIGTGEDNFIYLNGTSAFIGSGLDNAISASEGFIGAGEANFVHTDFAGIVSGYNNSIDTFGEYSSIGAGQQDTARAYSSFIGGGNTNLTNAPAKLGDFANIPGGDHLITQSYAQTAIGYYNKAQGTSIGYHPPALSPTRPNPNDRVLLVGNGFDTTVMHGITQVDSSVRSNAFEVSNNGHSIVYHTNGSGGATPGGLAPPVPGNAAIYAARCQDNTPIAWGDIAGIDSTSPSLRGRDTVFADYGVASVQYKATGEYLLTLNTVDSYTGTTISTFQDISVVATTRALGPFGPQCRLVQVTQAAEGSNQFYLWIQDLSCDLKNARVDFQVFARR